MMRNYYCNIPFHWSLAIFNWTYKTCSFRLVCHHISVTLYIPSVNLYVTKPTCIISCLPLPRSGSVPLRVGCVQVLGGGAAAARRLHGNLPHAPLRGRQAERRQKTHAGKEGRAKGAEPPILPILPMNALQFSPFSRAGNLTFPCKYAIAIDFAAATRH